MMDRLLYPSKKPKVSQVSEWKMIYNDELHNHWRGDAFNGVIVVSYGYPFADYLRAIYTPVTGKRVIKYFYGERAWDECRRYAEDLGFTKAYYGMN
jgi:hypothetical protein